MVTLSNKTKVIHYALMALIISFFMIPLATFYFFDCRFFAPKQMASVLLFFFR